MCPPTEIFCAQCEEEMSDKTQQHMITWTTSTAEKQFSNSVWIHSDCIAEQAHWVEMERPKTNESTVF